tara:strand:- start:309 stop:650 length:342 start_codon:yes stop_codon:yes gene_type:complete
VPAAEDDADGDGGDADPQNTHGSDQTGKTYAAILSHQDDVLYIAFLQHHLDGNHLVVVRVQILYDSRHSKSSNRDDDDDGDDDDDDYPHNPRHYVLHHRRLHDDAREDDYGCV